MRRCRAARARLAAAPVPRPPPLHHDLDADRREARKKVLLASSCRRHPDLIEHRSSDGPSSRIRPCRNRTAMSLLNIITSQLIDVIEWTDDSRDTLSYRWPDEDKEIKNGAQLIVRESQLVQFVAAGQYADLFTSRQAHPDDREHPDPVDDPGLEIRLPVAVQVRRLLPQHAALHRQQVGHGEPGDDARQGLRRRAAAGLRHL